MNVEIKAKWLEALRSGRYLQGSSCLRYKNKYCCLGVLLDQIDPTRWVLDKNGQYTWDGEEGVLPETVRVQCGLNSRKVKVHDGYVRSLAELNDMELYNFNKIADIIEEQL